MEGRTTAAGISSQVSSLKHQYPQYGVIGGASHHASTHGGTLRGSSPPGRGLGDSRMFNFSSQGEESKLSRGSFTTASGRIGSMLASNISNRSPSANHSPTPVQPTRTGSHSTSTFERLSESIFARGLSKRDSSPTTHGAESKIHSSIFSRGLSSPDPSPPKQRESKLSPSIFSRGLSSRETSPATGIGSTLSRNTNGGSNSPSAVHNSTLQKSHEPGSTFNTKTTSQYSTDGGATNATSINTADTVVPSNAKVISGISQPSFR